MSAHLIVPRAKQVHSDILRLAADKPVLLDKRPIPSTSKTVDFFGVLGATVVTIILGMSIYFVFRYLL